MKVARLMVAGTLLAASLAVLAQQPAAAPACAAPAGEVTMPSGVEPFRLKALDEGASGRRRPRDNFAVRCHRTD